MAAAARTAESVPSAAALLTGPPFSALSAALGRAVAAVDAAAMGGGLANHLTRISVTIEDGEVLQLALKAHHESTVARCAALGTAREALFYEHLAPALAALLPAWS